MNAVVQFVRWFNGAAPFGRYKNRLAAWASGHLAAAPGPQIYGGLQGRFRMSLDLSCQIERWMYLNNYEWVGRRVLRRLLRAGDVFVDCGAHVGFMTLAAARCVGPAGRVIAFEPMPETAERLGQNIRLNGLTNVEVIAKAVSDRSGTAALHSFHEGDAKDVSLGRLDGKTVRRQTPVQTVRLDEAIQPPVRLIKLDVEGAELAALRGGRGLLAACRPHMLIELNRLTARAFGYEPIDIVRWVLESVGDYHIRLLKSRKIRRITMDDLQALLQTKPQKLRNVWLEPAGSRRSGTHRP